jgi:hypothetical protein
MTTRSLRAVIAALALLVLAVPALAGERKTYGKGVSAPDTIKLSELVAHPDKYVDKTVRVEGVVLDVCPKRGCWMELSGDVEYKTVRIKVEDGVIVFPLDAKGKHAVAEGVFTTRPMSLDETKSYRQHIAEEKGEKFDPASVKEAMTIYMLRGTGAVIE